MNGNGKMDPLGDTLTGGGESLMIPTKSPVLLCGRIDSQSGMMFGVLQHTPLCVKKICNCIVPCRADTPWKNLLDVLELLVNKNWIGFHLSIYI